MTVLYLHKMRDLSISLDGPSLAVQGNGQATRLHPLTRLERVHIPASMEIDSKLLLRMALAGVAVALCRRDGSPLAWCLPSVSEKPLASNIQKFDQRPDATVLLMAWRHTQFDVLLRRLRHCFRLQTTSSLEDVERSAHHILLKFTTGEADVHAARQWLREEIEGRLMILLTERGVDGEAALRFSGHLAPLLELRLLPTLILWLGRRFTSTRKKNQPLPRLTQSVFMGFFELRRQALDKAAEEMLDQFETWLKETTS